MDTIEVKSTNRKICNAVFWQFLVLLHQAQLSSYFIANLKCHYGLYIEEINKFPLQLTIEQALHLRSNLVDS